MQSYIDAIEIIANASPDYRAIGIALAKSRPELFVELHNQTDITHAPKWIGTAISYLRTDHLVNAIKETRAATGLGLRDAKGVIDHAAYILGLRDEPSISLDTPEMRGYVNQLVAYGKATR